VKPCKQTSDIESVTRYCALRHANKRARVTNITKFTFAHARQRIGNFIRVAQDRPNVENGYPANQYKPRQTGQWSQTYPTYEHIIWVADRVCGIRRVSDDFALVVVLLAPRALPIWAPKYGPAHEYGAGGGGAGAGTTDSPKPPPIAPNPNMQKAKRMLAAKATLLNNNLTTDTLSHPIRVRTVVCFGSLVTAPRVTRVGTH
jgi:hypothetical protein